MGIHGAELSLVPPKEFQQVHQRSKYVVSEILLLPVIKWGPIWVCAYWSSIMIFHSLFFLHTLPLLVCKVNSNLYSCSSKKLSGGIRASWHLWSMMSNGPCPIGSVLQVLWELFLRGSRGARESKVDFMDKVLGRGFVGPCPHRDRNYRIGSNFWKFYLIRTGFALGELVSLVKLFRLFRLERFFWCSECGHSR